MAVPPMVCMHRAEGELGCRRLVPSRVRRQRSAAAEVLRRDWEHRRVTRRRQHRRALRCKLLRPPARQDFACWF